MGQRGRHPGFRPPVRDPRGNGHRGGGGAAHGALQAGAARRLPAVGRRRRDRGRGDLHRGAKRGLFRFSIRVRVALCHGRRIRLPGGRGRSAFAGPDGTRGGCSRRRPPVQGRDRRGGGRGAAPRGPARRGGPVAEAADCGRIARRSGRGPGRLWLRGPGRLLGRARFRGAARSVFAAARMATGLQPDIGLRRPCGLPGAHCLGPLSRVGAPRGGVSRGPGIPEGGCAARSRRPGLVAGPRGGRCLSRDPDRGRPRRPASTPPVSDADRGRGRGDRAGVARRRRRSRACSAASVRLFRPACVAGRPQPRLRVRHDALLDPRPSRARGLGRRARARHARPSYGSARRAAARDCLRDPRPGRGGARPAGPGPAHGRQRSRRDAGRDAAPAPGGGGGHPADARVSRIPGAARGHAVGTSGSGCLQLRHGACQSPAPGADPSRPPRPGRRARRGGTDPFGRAALPGACGQDASRMGRRTLRPRLCGRHRRGDPRGLRDIGRRGPGRRCGAPPGARAATGSVRANGPI